MKIGQEKYDIIYKKYQEDIDSNPEFRNAYRFIKEMGDALFMWAVMNKLNPYEESHVDKIKEEAAVNFMSYVVSGERPVQLKHIKTVSDLTIKKNKDRDNIEEMSFMSHPSTMFFEFICEAINESN